MTEHADKRVSEPTHRTRNAELEAWKKGVVSELMPHSEAFERKER
jgi:hypothetical protein